MAKRIIIVLVLAGAAGITGWLALRPVDNRLTPTPVISTAPSEQTDVQLAIGASDAPLTIVEYIDYKCPNCNKFHRETYPKLKSDYLDKGRARLRIRHLPYIADDSQRAAEGAYCAADQNKFEQYHDAVLHYMWTEHYSKGTDAEFKDVLTQAQLGELAAGIGIERDKFDTCLQEATHKPLVTADLQASAEDEATGTPTFIVGDQKLTGNQPYLVFETVIATQL